MEMEREEREEQVREERVYVFLLTSPICFPLTVKVKSDKRKLKTHPPSLGRNRPNDQRSKFPMRKYC
jgi:hypothetical protein